MKLENIILIIISSLISMVVCVYGCTFLLHLTSKTPVYVATEAKIVPIEMARVSKPTDGEGVTPAYRDNPTISIAVMV